MNDVHLSMAIFGGLALTLGLLSRWLKQSFISENILALAIGIAAGPLALDLIDISEWGSQETILQYVAQVAVAIAVMEIALRLPKREFIDNLKPLAIMLGAIMPLMWITTGLLVWLILDLPFWLALLLGAILTPTDPVVASSVVTGPIASANLPTRLRDTIWAESGANDGLAHAFVMLPILVLASSLTGSLGNWLLTTILFEVGVGALLGAGIGYGAARLLIWAETRHTIESEAFRTFTLALSLTTLGIASIARTEGLLAVFVAGVVFHMTVAAQEDDEVEPIQGAIDHFFTIPVSALIGIAIPFDAWLDLGWRAPLLIIAIIFLRRLPALALVSRWVDTLRTWPDVLFVGWFGPIGIAALYYATFGLKETGHEVVWIVGSLIICSSIVIHGLTAAPLSKLYGRLAPSDSD
ncbi:MAG: cation:proton antiporter [Thermomicrobiaceae bacterium]